MSFSTALSGLNAASSDLNVISNNIANANTVGFKGSNAEFADIYANAGGGTSNTEVGNGVNLAEVAQQFQQGNIQNTQNSLDLAINGSGFFTLKGAGGFVYTRAGDFQKDKNGFVVDNLGQNLQVFPPTTNGGFNTGSMQNLQILTTTGNAKATTSAQLAFNLPANAAQPVNPVFNPTDPTSFNEAIPFTVYDSQGLDHNATAYFVKTATANQWQVNLQVAGQSAGSDTITFSPNGGLATPAGGNLAFTAVTVSPGANPITLTLNASNATQLGSDFSTGAINQNGFQPGQLTGVSVSGTGVVSANFSNGQSQALGQVAMATFANQQGLDPLSNTDWAESSASGLPVYGSANSNGVGALQSSALEESNTSDVTSQLVGMIQAQRNYEANAKVLTTNQQTMTALLNAVQ